MPDCALLPDFRGDTVPTALKLFCWGSLELDAGDLISRLNELGYDFFCGVPCSSLKPVINSVLGSSSHEYVGATSEGEAVALAAGAWLAGRRSVVLMQNSGLGNAVNPLTSLNFPFRIPGLMLVSWRGEPGHPDEPQHELMGRITGPLLDVMGLGNRVLSDDIDSVMTDLSEAEDSMARSSLPYALIVRDGTFEKIDTPTRTSTVPARGSKTDTTANAAPPSRIAVLQRLLSDVPDDAALIATTGKSGRELYSLSDREQHLYMVGSMGCASAVGLGVALSSRKRVIVIDGDGAALMKMGNMATIGAMSPVNLIHIVLDNGVHDSTGGQATVSDTVDFSGVAVSVGYRQAHLTNSEDGFSDSLRDAMSKSGPTMIHVRIAPGSIDPLGRPKIKPDVVARRFRDFVCR